MSDLDKIRESTEIIKEKYPLIHSVSRILIIGLKWFVLAVVALVVIIYFWNKTPDQTHETIPNYETLKEVIVPSFEAYLGKDKVTDYENKITFSSLELYNLGNRVNNDFGYSIYNDRETSGTFLKVIFSITNTGTSTNFTRINFVKLKDQDGREFFPDQIFTCSNPFNENSYNNSQNSYSWMFLKPGIPCRVSVLFEVSTESKMFYFLINHS